jgi:ligand-binding sensor domain-containing protein
LSVTEGLSDLVVNAIYKDSLGYVWLGTGNSLECFDGIHFKHYLIPGSDEKLKRVNAIAEMPGNELWMGKVVDYGVLASRKIVWSPLPVKR